MDYETRFRELHINKSHGTESPHKPAMLLAVIDTIAASPDPRNRIEFTPDLVDRFRGYFGLVRTERDHPHAHYPFFHLKSELFWRHVPKTGHETILENLSTARKASHITDNVDHAELDPELFEMVKDQGGRKRLRDALIERYFPDRAELVLRHIDEEELSDAYAAHLDGVVSGVVAEEPAGYGDQIRDRAFRRKVVPAYDYRCAACGLRLLLDGETIVDACHLIPVSETRDDDPRNGMALCKNHHWSMDRHLIAPGPDMKWHASPRLDDRIESERLLRDLAGRSLVGPIETRYRPRDDALRWRMMRLA